MKRLSSALALTIGLTATACAGGSERGVAGPTTTSGAAATTARIDEERVCLSDPPGGTRCWLERDASTQDPASLLIDLHGAGQTAARLRKYSGMEAVAAREGLVVVWPESPDLSWNDGSCCGPAQADGRDDVAFISELIEHVSARLPVDPQRVYLTGFSNGCALAQLVAVRRSDLIAAVACYSDYLFDEPTPGYEPVPVLQVHGTADDAVPYSARGSKPGAIENAESWARHNACASVPEISETDELVTYRFVDCRDDAEVVHIAIVDGGHVPTPEVEIHEALWEFLEQH